MPDCRVTAYIRLDESGQHLTDVVVDGELRKTVPTHPSQIPQVRESLIWSPPDPITSRLKAMSKEIASGI
jgi:hypothetical protein